MGLSICNILYRFLLASSLLCSVGVSADDIVLMANEMSSVLIKLKAEIEQQSSNFNVTIITQDRPAAFPSSSYIVSVGSHSVNRLFRERAKGVISILITEEQYKKVPVQSSIYVEPPFDRQLRLTNELFPNSKIGVLVVDEDQSLSIKRILTEQQYSLLNIIKLSDYGNLNLALHAVLKKSDVLLGVYDNKIYNSQNIKNILISSYRQQKVLVGPSKAYLKAGSFVSTFSNLSHIAKRLIDIVLIHKAQGRWLEAGFNPYYEIVLNQQVGHSLNITLPDPELLAKKMKEAE